MAAVSVVEDGRGVARLHINNRIQEGSSASGAIERRLALLPLQLHPKPRQALFLGLGTGYTVQVAARDPGSEAGVEIGAGEDGKLSRLRSSFALHKKEREERETTV